MLCFGLLWNALIRDHAIKNSEILCGTRLKQLIREQLVLDEIDASLLFSELLLTSLHYTVPYSLLVFRHPVSCWTRIFLQPMMWHLEISCPWKYFGSWFQSQSCFGAWHLFVGYITDINMRSWSRVFTSFGQVLNKSFVEQLELAWK